MKTLWHLVHAPISLFIPSTNASSIVASAVSWDADVGRTDMLHHGQVCPSQNILTDALQAFQSSQS